jgi:eukaryotic-like serine/threonine-protein kinase
MRHIVPICAAVAATAAIAGTVIAVRAATPSIDAALVHVPSSTVLMGSAPGQGADDERPRHAVRVSGFRLDRTEVTNGRYAACVAEGACKAPMLVTSEHRLHYFGDPAFADHPVIFVSWADADAFCHWANGRLPTEAEWELAARGPAPSVRTYPWGDEKPDCARANMGGAEGCVGDTDRVGKRPAGASPFGALDMAGNVWEWTADWYDAQYYDKSPSTDPKGPPTGTLKVMRGGCWMSGADSLRVSCRKPELPSAWAPNVGFRCAYPEAR